MANDIVDLLDTAISAVSGWFSDIMGATGLTALYLCFMFLLLACSYFFAPILHAKYEGMLSDTAAKSKKDKNKGDRK